MPNLININIIIKVDVAIFNDANFCNKGNNYCSFLSSDDGSYCSLFGESLKESDGKLRKCKDCQKAYNKSININ